MADFFKDNLGYELTDCICGGRPELISMRGITITTGYCPYLYFIVRCQKCGRTVGPCVDEKDVASDWNRYMKRRPEE